MIKDYSTKRAKPDYLLAIAVFILIVLGLIMIYSSSVIISHERVGHGYYYLVQQAISLGVGIAAWLIFQSIDYYKLKEFSFVLLVGSIILLVLVLIPGLGPEGVKRWISIAGFNFQPSELVKLFFVIYLAGWLSGKKEEITSLTKGLLPFLFIVGVFVGLIILEPDLGSAAIFAGTGLVMFFLAGGKIYHVITTVLLGSSLFYLMIVAAPYRLKRLTTFLNPEANPMESGWQLRNALIAIGSGGLFGLGFGKSAQKYLYLPEAHTDSIFAIIAEELGFSRAFLIIAAFIFFAWRGYLIAKEAPNTFGRLLAGGITTWFVLQAFINIGAMLGVIPLTGLTLPFISYGGSSLVISLAGVGILLNISKHAQAS